MENGATMSTRTTILQKAADLTDRGLDYVGPGPCPSSTWAYDSVGRAVVLDKDGREIDRNAVGSRARTVARSAELIVTMRIPNYRVRYATTGAGLWGSRRRCLSTCTLAGIGAAVSLTTSAMGSIRTGPA